MLEGGTVHLKIRALGTPGDHLAEPAQQTGVEAMWPHQPSGNPGFPLLVQEQEIVLLLILLEARARKWRWPCCSQHP